MKVMISGLTVFAFLASAFFASAQTHFSDSPDHLVSQVVHDFAGAIASRDIYQLEKLLHPEFRVVANQYPNADVTSVLNREIYLSLMESGKIGGTAYNVAIKLVEVVDHSATAITTFTAEGSVMHLTLLLVRDAEGSWRIVSDLAVMQTK